MKLYRITWEYYDGFETRQHFEYLWGNRALGKAVAWGVKDGDTLVDVVRLQPTLEAIKICAQHTHSSFPNKCVIEGRCF